MPLTREFKATVQERANKDPAFRAGLLKEAAGCLLNNEVSEAKLLLRDYVNATLGFEELGLITGKQPQSLMRMLGPAGNPSLHNISLIIATLTRYEGLKLQIQAGFDDLKAGRVSTKTR